MFEYVSVDRPECTFGTVLEAFGESLQDLILEIRARVSRGDGVNVGLVEFAVSDSEYVGLHTRCHQGDFGFQSGGDLGRRVQSDAFPHCADVGFVDSVAGEESPRFVGAVQFET